ncbi:MAG: CBS domain-containing protein [Chloroflexi bacterium]|nr:CBS domain-containing protein [Chloroflexota bacterium]
MRTPVYVIGHVNPDTDSIASAIGYAWLLHERDGIDAIAARSGVINQQTSWVLDFLGLKPPFLLNDASPKFGSVAIRLDTTTPERPLSEAWGIASKTGGVAPIITEDNRPYGLVTGASLFKLMAEYVGPNAKSNETAVNQILELPCREAADTSIPHFNSSTRIKDLIRKVLHEEGDDFWVVDDNGKYTGIARKSDLIHPPRIKLILVDHNEAQQAVSSFEEAELIEILDHHRLGNLPTNSPIHFTVVPVGSTSTLVTERIAEAGLSAPPEIAGILLAGIISDTLHLISPTTTERDKNALKRLSRWAFAADSPLAKETIESYAEQILTSGSGLSARPPREIITTDVKTYEAGDYKFSISQVEVSDLYELGEHINDLRKALEEYREIKEIHFAVLMVTDVVRGSSRILMANPPAILEDLPFNPTQDGTLLAEGMVSRKKQLVPIILSQLEV